MGILGRILIVLNMLAAVAFVYLAIADWGVRREWAASAFKHKLLEVGFPLEAPENPPADLDSSYVPFLFEVSPTIPMTEIRKEVLQKIVPNGGEYLGGGDAPSNQTAEVTRVRDRVLQLIDGQTSADAKRALMRTILLNLAQSGEERDGVNALLRDLFNKARAADSRRELRLLGRNPSQQNALDAILALSVLNDDVALQNAFVVDLARKAIGSACRSEIPNLVASDMPEEQRNQAIAQLAARLNDLLVAVNAAKPNPTQVEQRRESLKTDASDGVKTIADLAGNLLRTKDEVADARTKLTDLCQSHAATETEKKAITSLIQFISDPNANVEQAVEEIGKAYVTRYFDDAALPVSKSTAKSVREASEKRQQIAHLLYHLDSSPEWQQRVQVIVGYSNYVRSIEAQATQLGNMAQRTLTLVNDENQRFMPEFQEVVQRALFLGSKVSELKQQASRQVGLLATHETNFNNRAAEREDLDKELAKLKVDAKTALKTFETEQDRLIVLTQQLREAQDRLFNLEEQLRMLEAKVAPR